MNLRPSTDQMLTELCFFLKVKKAPFLEELLSKLYDYFNLFQPRKGWKLDYNIEVLRSRLVIEFSGFPSTLVCGSFPSKTLLSEEKANELIRKDAEKQFNERDQNE